MCGIVGLFLKNRSLEDSLGQYIGMMLRELSDRGPDSAGFAVYSGDTRGVTKICMVARGGAVDWTTIAGALGKAIGADVAVETLEDHAIFRTSGAGDVARKWLIDNVPSAYVLSQGHSIEIFKGVGRPEAIIDRLDLETRTGTHAIGHTRMATESAVIVAGSHPFSTGDDTCLVHNGSLSNHNRLREQLAPRWRALPDRQRQRSRSRISGTSYARGRHAQRRAGKRPEGSRRLLHLRRRHA